MAKPGSGLSRRYLGINLSGAKSNKTALAVLEYYPKEKKTFLLDLYERMNAKEGQSPDEALVESVLENRERLAVIGTDAPLSFPPCIHCESKGCRTPGRCGSQAARWMERFLKKISRKTKVLPFTPYTQRPVELWLRYQVLSKLHARHRFDLDETLGGSKAPLTARMTHLQRFFKGIPTIEAIPKLTVACLAERYSIPTRHVLAYRTLEHGPYSRSALAETFAEHCGIFVYERDLHKLASSLNAFDAFVCALTAHFDGLGLCVPAPKGFPVESGWVRYPFLKGEA